MCGLSCSAACGILVPQPGTQPMSSALKGGFFSTESPGKFWSYLFLDQPLNPLCFLQLLQLFWKCNYLKVQLLDRVWGWWWRRAGVSSWRSHVSCVKMKEPYSEHWGGPLCFPELGGSMSFVCFWHVDGPFRNRHHLCLLAQLLQTCPTVFDPMDCTPPPTPTRLLYPWDSPGKNTRVGCHFLLQGVFFTQESNPHLLCLLHWQEFLTTGTSWEAPPFILTPWIFYWWKPF